MDKTTHNELVELGKRAVVCKGFRWMPGMAVVGDLNEGSGRVVRVGMGYGAGAEVTVVLDVEEARSDDEPWNKWPVMSCSGGQGVQDGQLRRGWLPDLDDPATIGCLLALVREWCGDAFIAVWWSTVVQGYVVSGKNDYIVTAKTEAEALVNALEAAGEQ